MSMKKFERRKILLYSDSLGQNQRLLQVRSDNEQVNTFRGTVSRSHWEFLNPRFVTTRHTISSTALSSCEVEIHSTDPICSLLPFKTCRIEYFRAQI